MASSRIARLFMEVAPPQYVTVMRQRTSKMLDTISEEEREVNPNDSVISNIPKSSSSSSSSAAASASASASSSASPAASASATTATANTKYFLKEVHRSLSMLNH